MLDFDKINIRKEKMENLKEKIEYYNHQIFDNEEKRKKKRIINYGGCKKKWKYY